MEKIVAACGNDCSACPRYSAHPCEKTDEELRHTAELWRKIGYRDHVASKEEIVCFGCTPENWCRYRVAKCCSDRGIPACAECQNYPCETIRECFSVTKSFEPMCRLVCTQDEYEQLRKAFFEKERNLESRRSATPEGWGLQFGMPTLIENRTLEENAALCGELGLRFIELNMNFPEYQADALEKTDELIRIAERYRLYYTIHLDENLNIADFNPLVTRAYLETVRRTILAAKALLPLRDRYGDPRQPLTLNMHMHHGVHITLPDRKVQMYERDFDTYMKSFAHFRALCEEWIGGSGIMINVENTDGFREYEKKAIEYLLESPRFGLTWDIGHSKAIGEKDVPFLLEHRERLTHFHIHDGTETPPGNHLALGDGEIDLAERLRLAQSRHARCVLETKTIAALKQSVQWLRENRRR